MQQIGKYQLVRKLATGGMAEVFLAKAAGPMGFEKTLVVKRILPHLAEDPAFVEMFLGEAKLAAQLNHPNVVQIFDFGEADGAYFIAMEFIDGPHLRSLYKRARELGKQLPLALCAKAISFAAEGLAYAHDFADPNTGEPMGLIHRDISPDNILVARTGSVKVVDFGIAKAAGQSHHTKTGTLKGKLAYMPPEQLHQKPLDRRADVFALGMVLYELVTFQKPFDASSEVNIMRAILYEPMIPASERRPDVPQMLQGILDRALAKDRDERYPSCREFQVDLERFIVSQGEPVGAFQLSTLVKEFGTPAAAPVGTPAAGSQPGSNTTPGGTPKSGPGTQKPSGSSPGAGVMYAPEPAPQAVPLDRPKLTPSVPAQRSPEPTKATALAPVMSVAPEFEVDLRTQVDASALRPRTAKPVADTERMSSVPSEDFAPVAPRRSPVPIVAGVIVLLAAAGGGVYFAMRSSVPEPTPRPLSDLTKATPISRPANDGTPHAGTTGSTVATTKPSTAATSAHAGTGTTGATVAGTQPSTGANTATGTAGSTVAGTQPSTGANTGTGTTGSTVAGTQPSTGAITATGATGSTVAGTQPSTGTNAPNAGAGNTGSDATAHDSAQTVAAVAHDAADKKGKNSKHGKTEVVAMREPAPTHATDTAPTPTHTSAALASFRVETTPPAQVKVNGKFVGVSPVQVNGIPPGDVNLLVYDSRLGFTKKQTFSATAGDNGTRKVVVASGTLTFRVRPYAEVFLDDKPLGQTPFDPVSVYEGEHTIRLVNRDLGKNVSVSYDMKPGANVFKYNLEE